MNTSAADANRRLFNASSSSTSSFMSGNNNNTLPSSIHRSSFGLSTNKSATNTKSNNSRTFVQEREAQERARRSYALYFLRLLGITILCVVGVLVLWQYGVFSNNVKSMRGYAPTHVFTHHDRVRHSNPVAINDPQVDDSASVIIDGVEVGVVSTPSHSDRPHSTFSGGDINTMYGQEDNGDHHRPMTSGGSLSQMVYTTIFGADDQEEDATLVGGDFINIQSSDDDYTAPPTIPTPETPDPAGTGAIVGLFVLLVNMVNNIAPLLAVLGILYAIYRLIELCTVRGSRRYFRSFCEQELEREALRLRRGGAGATVTGQQKDDFTKLILDGSIDMASNPSLWLSATVSAGKSLFKTEGPLVVPTFDSRSTTAASSSVANHRRGAAAGAAANDVNTQEDLNRYIRISEDTENEAALVASSSNTNDPSGSRFRFLRDGADAASQGSSFQYGSQQEKAKKTQGVGVVYGSLQSQAFTDQNANTEGTNGASIQQSAATRRLVELLERVTRNGGISGDSIPRGLSVSASAVMAFDREWEAIKMNMLTWAPLNVKNPNQSVQNARRWVCSVFNKLWSDIEACNKSLVTDGAQLVIPMPQATTPAATTTGTTTTGAGFGGAKPGGFGGGGGGFGGGATTGGGFGGGAAATTAANTQPKELTLMGLSIYECSLALCSPDPGIAATLAAQKAASTTTTTTGTTTGGFGGAKPGGFGGGGGGFGGGATTGGFGGGATANKAPEASPNQCALTALLNEKSRLTSMGVASNSNLISRVEAIKRRISLEVTLDMAASLLYAAAAACYRQASSAPAAPAAAGAATAAKPATGGFGGGTTGGGFGGGGGFGKPATGGGFGGGATTGGGFGSAAPAAAAAPPQSPPHYMMPAERQRMRNYILNRIRKFAHDPTLRSFRNNGVDIPEWEESFPQDPHLILHVLSTRCEAFNPSIVSTDLEQGGGGSAAPATTTPAPAAGGFGATAAAPAAPAAAVSKPHVQLNTGPIRLAHLPGLSTVAPPPPILQDSAAPQGLEASRRQIPPQHHPVLFVGSAAQPYFYVGVPQVPGAAARGDADLSLFMSSGGRPDDSSSSNMGGGAFPMAGSAAWGNTFGEDGSSFGMGTSSPAAAPTFFRTSHSTGDSLFEAMVVYASLRKMATPPPTEEQKKASATRSRQQLGSRPGAAESDGESGAAYGDEDQEDAEAAHLTNEDVHTRTLNRIVE